MDVQQVPTTPSVQTQPPQGGAPVQPPQATVVQPVSQAVPTKPRKKAGWLIGIIALLLAGAGFYVFFPTSSIVIPSQPPGSTSIHVTKLDLARPGWLLISRVSVAEGVDHIAVSAYLDPEEYQEFDLPLKDPSEPLTAGYFLYGALYQDSNGNQSFDDNVDQPMRDWLGRRIRVKFRVL